jgi:hypothetical protein
MWFTTSTNGARFERSMPLGMRMRHARDGQWNPSTAGISSRQVLHCTSSESSQTRDIVFARGSRTFRVEKSEDQALERRANQHHQRVVLCCHCGT